MSNTCLYCPLPDCDEKDPRCLLHQRPKEKRVSIWHEQLQQVIALEEGESARFGGLTHSRLKSLRSAIYHGKGSKQVRTRSWQSELGEELYDLEVQAYTPTSPGRRWSIHAEALDVVDALPADGHCSFVLSTITELQRLQNAIWQQFKHRGVRTWREDATLHVIGPESHPPVSRPRWGQGRGRKRPSSSG